MQDKNVRTTSASYRKDVRIPIELWDQIKDLPNVSKFIIQAISDKLNSQNENKK